MKQLGIIFIFSLILAGCSAQPVYYKNYFYTNNVQEYLNRDLQYCEAIARGYSPVVVPQVPQGTATTYGNGVILDNNGNFYNISYNNTFVPSTSYSINNSLNSIGKTLEASRIYTAIKSRCLAERGWYQISKEEYESSIK